MKNNKLKTKIISLIIAFVIAVILSGIISMILHLIFIKVPEEILNITPTKILKSLIENKEHFEMFILTIISFMLFALLTIFKVFDLKDYKAKNYKVTNNIEIPLPVGESQNQQGSAWWLPKKEYSKVFGVNRLDPKNPEIEKIIKVVNKEKSYIESNKAVSYTHLTLPTIA